MIDGFHFHFHTFHTSPNKGEEVTLQCYYQESSSSVRNEKRTTLFHFQRTDLNSFAVGNEINYGCNTRGNKNNYPLLKCSPLYKNP